MFVLRTACLRFTHRCHLYMSKCVPQFQLLKPVMGAPLSQNQRLPKIQQMEMETNLQSWQLHSPQLLKQVSSKLLIACLSSEVALMSQCKPGHWSVAKQNSDLKQYEWKPRLPTPGSGKTTFITYTERASSKRSGRTTHTTTLFYSYPILSDTCAPRTQNRDARPFL